MKVQRNPENPEDVMERETEPTSPSTVILAAIIVSIPLALCCYLLLRL